MNIINFIKIFIKSDLRQKLTKLKIYPTFFYSRGIKSIYPKIIFNLILGSKFKKFKQQNYKKIFINRKENYKYNSLVSLPKSGSMATRLMLISYFEINYKIGNGIPKYDPINNKWIFPLSNIESNELQNSLIYDSFLFNRSSGGFNNYIGDEEFEKKKIIFSRHPLTRSDIYKLENSRVAIILRKPQEQILSYCANYNFYNNDKQKLDNKLFLKAYNDYLKFLKYWDNKLKNYYDKKDYLILKYEDINTEPEICLKKLLLLYNYDINDEQIKLVAKIHSKENTIKYLENVNFKKIRFTDENKKKILKQEINVQLENLEKKGNLVKFYNEFLKN